MPFKEDMIRDGETMEGPLNITERRSHPRIIIDLPLGHQDTNGPCLRGATLITASEGGGLIETDRDIPVGTELSISVLFPKGYEFANFKVAAKTVWKASKQRKKYQYGLEFIQISHTDLWKLKYLLGGRLESEKTSPGLSCQL